MGKGYKHGGSGGTALNFNVKTYPSETELKADEPRENTIGVITTTTMTSWVFSATEPKEPEVGMVWFSLGTSSATEFNALKKNELQVYPVSSKQYVGGKFEVVISMTYQDEEWHDWGIILFDGVLTTVYGTLGNPNNYSIHDPNNNNRCDFSYVVADKKLTCTFTPKSSASYSSGIGYFYKKVNLTNKNAIEFTLDSANCSLFVFVTDTIKDMPTRVATHNTKAPGAYSIDISALSGEYYVAIGAYENTSNKMTIVLSDWRIK